VVVEHVDERVVPDAGATTVRAIVWATRLVALLTLATAVLPGPRRAFGAPLRSTLDLPAAVGVTGATIGLVAGAGLVLLAAGLRWRKRRAWLVATCLTAMVAVTNLVRGIEGSRGLLAGLTASALLVALIMARHRFVARPDPGGVGRALVALVQLAGTGFLLVWLLLAVEPRRLAGSPSALDCAQHALYSLIGMEGPVRFVADWFDDVTSAIGLTAGAAAVLVAGYFLLRSAEPRPGRDAVEDARLRALLTAHGSADSLGYFALRADKEVVFSPSGKAAVAHRVLAGVALASGDPVGDPEAWPGGVAAFLADCTANGWVPGVLGCSERGAGVYARFGLDALEIGDEAVLRTAGFSLDGRAMRGVRQSVARARRAGYEVRVRTVAEVSVAERDALAALAAGWRGVVSDPTGSAPVAERGYSMALSRVADAVDPAAVLVPTERDGQVHALLQLVPWGTDGLSLDSMRRDPAADGGLTELMIAELMAAAPGRGVARVSLNFAVFRAALERGGRIGAGPVARLWARVLRAGSRWWQLESLYRFNAKFGPEWTPRFVAFPSARALPRVLVAALEAEGFGGRPPALLRLLRR
jgi:lysyl-tRNA synthetase, class II